MNINHCMIPYQFLCILFFIAKNNIKNNILLIFFTKKMILKIHLSVTKKLLQDIKKNLEILFIIIIRNFVIKLLARFHTF